MKHAALFTALLLFALCLSATPKVLALSRGPGGGGGGGTNAFGVENTNDSGTGSLRAAIASANAQPGSIVYFDNTVFTSPNMTVSLTSGEINISASVTLEGPTVGVNISANNASRVCEVSGGTANISNITFENGNAANGGGMYIDSGALASFTNCSFRNNTANYSGMLGGGVYDAGAITLTNCVFDSNQSIAGAGGGLLIENSATATVRDCIFDQNSVIAGAGSAIFSYGTSDILNCIFNGNASLGSQGAASSGTLANRGTMTVTNCTVSGNKAPNATGGGFANYSGATTLVNDIFYGDSGKEIVGFVTASYSDIQGGYSGTGNIDANPDFTSSTNFSLQSNSPCIGAGATQSEAPSGVTIPTTAINGATRPTPPSIGAYDVSPNSLAPTVTLTSNINPSGSGQSVTFTATASVTATGAPITTGQFEFYAVESNSQENSGLLAVSSAGQATYTLSNLTAGGNSIAVYYVPAANSVYQQVEKTLTQNVVSLSFGLPGSATSGSPISVSVTANPTTYNGTVTITSSDPKATLPSGPITLSNGTATFNVTFNTGGDQTITATDTTNSAITGTSASRYVYVPPTANPQSDSTPFDNPVVGYLTGSDPEGTALTYNFGTQASHGNASIVNTTTGQFVYVPNNGFQGTDSFTFTVTDGYNLVSQPATVTIKVAAGPPTAKAQSVTTNENTPANITLTGTDPDNPPLALTYAIASQPAHGALGALNTSTGAVTYTPSPGYYGPDSFTFTVSNGTNTSAAATVSITVSQTFSAPTANPQTVAVPFGTATAVTLSGSDPQGEALTYSVTGGPSNGKLSGTAPNLTYTPNAGFHGTDSFTFTVTDSHGLTSAPATVTLNVGTGTPTANSQSVSTSEGAAKAITLSGSDPDNPALPLTYKVASGPSHGSLSGTAPNLTYTPAAGYYGPDSFTFTVSNGTNTSTTATVSITVYQVFAAPTANSQTVHTPLDQAVVVTPSGSDPQGQTLSFAIKTQPANGSAKVTFVGPGMLRFTYTPNAGFQGTDSFTFTVTNQSGLTSAPATITINVAAGTPTAYPQGHNARENAATNITLTGSDPDVPALPLTYAIASQPTHGTLGTLNTSTGTVTYTPAPGYYGPDSFTFTVSNGTNTSTTATVSITVYQVFAAPTANSQTVHTPLDQAVVVTPSGSDPQGQTLSFAIKTQPANGSAKVTFVGPGMLRFTYTPNAGFQGTDSFTFTVTNQSGLTSAPATITINVATGTPSANGQSVSTGEGAAVGITLTGSDPDVPALPLTYAIATQPTHGTLGTLNTSTGAVTYTPSPGYYGPDSFTFTVSNGTNTSTAATVSITVSQAATHFSVIPAGTATTGQPLSVTVTALDAGNRPVSGYSGTAVLTDTDPRADPAGSISLTNGVGTGAITFFTAGTQTVTATAGSLSGMGAVTVASSGSPRVAVTSVIVSANGSTATAQVTLQDTGTGQASMVHLTLARMSGKPALGVPSAITLGAGQSQTLTLTFPNQAPGMKILILSGGYSSTSGTAGAFSAVRRISLP